MKLSNELLLYGIGSFCPDMAILAVSTQEIFLPLPLLLPSTGISSTCCNFIYRDDIVLNPTISPEYFLYFQKAKTDKAMSGNDTRSVFKPLSLFFYPTCAFYTRLARGMTLGVKVIRLVFHELEDYAVLQKHCPGEYIKEADFAIAVTRFSVWSYTFRNFRFCVKIRYLLPLLFYIL